MCIFRLRFVNNEASRILLDSSVPAFDFDPDFLLNKILSLVQTAYSVRATQLFSETSEGFSLGHINYDKMTLDQLTS